MYKCSNEITRLCRLSCINEPMRLENRRFRSEFGLHRLALHALALRFDHPHTGAPLEVYAPPPDDLRVPLERIGFSPSLWTREATLDVAPDVAHDVAFKEQEQESPHG